MSRASGQPHPGRQEWPRPQWDFASVTRIEPRARERGRQRGRLAPRPVREVGGHGTPPDRVSLAAAVAFIVALLALAIGSLA